MFWLSSLSTRTKFRNTGVKTLHVKRRKPMFTIKTGIWGVGVGRRISGVGLCNIIPLSSTTNYKSSSIRVQVYHVLGILSGITLRVSTSSWCLFFPHGQHTCWTALAGWGRPPTYQDPKWRVGVHWPLSQGRFGLKFKSLAAFRERKKTGFTQYVTADAAVHVLCFLFYWVGFFFPLVSLSMCFC